MSERRFTAGDSSGEGSFQAEMWRRTPSGELVLFEVDFNDYCHPPKGRNGRFELHGWSPYYETQSTFDGVTKTVTRMRAEYRIIKLAGDPQGEFTDGLFAQQFPVPKHIENEKSKLGNFLRALLNRGFEPGEDVNPDDFIGTEFVTSVTRDEVKDGDKTKIYCGISWDTIDPTKTKLSPYLNRQPELAGVAVGGGDDEDDPFLGAGEDEDL